MIRWQRSSAAFLDLSCRGTRPCAARTVRSGERIEVFPQGHEHQHAVVQTLRIEFDADAIYLGRTGDTDVLCAGVTPAYLGTQHHLQIAKQKTKQKQQTNIDGLGEPQAYTGDGDVVYIVDTMPPSVVLQSEQGLFFVYTDDVAFVTTALTRHVYLPHGTTNLKRLAALGVRILVRANYALRRLGFSSGS